MIDVVDFHKAYADQIAVRGISFCVRPGEVLGIIGPNGAGKTTTMRAIAGIIPPSRGRLSVAGHDLTTDALAAKRELAFVPDDPPLFHDLTVEEHLAFYGSVYRVAGAREKAAHLLDEFELSSKASTAASNLSRGMRQKLAVCCAYLHDPRAILFDEPLTGLDPQGIRVFKRSLQARAAEGAAVMISSHLLAMVEDLCSHVLILSGGVQRFCGPIESLRASFDTVEADASLEDIFFAATS